VRAAGRCDGFDIDVEGLSLLREHFPDQHFVQHDIAETVPLAYRGAYDLVIAGEVLEHIPCPGRFLRGCAELLADGGLLCITVPNAVAPKNGLRTIAGIEVVHPDHFAYYSPRTLSRTLMAQGFEIESIGTCFERADLPGKVLNLGLRVLHYVRRGPVGDGIVATASHARHASKTISQGANESADR
jgi:SAM-dependent methyltransferase